MTLLTEVYQATMMNKPLLLWIVLLVLLLRIVSVYAEESISSGTSEGKSQKPPTFEDLETCNTEVGKYFVDRQNYAHYVQTNICPKGTLT